MKWTMTRAVVDPLTMMLDYKYDEDIHMAEYAHFGWKWFNRTYDFGGSFETGEGKVVTLESMKLLPPIKEGGNYGCCCEKKYGKK